MAKHLTQTLRNAAAALLLLAPATAAAAQAPITQASFNLHSLTGLPVYAIDPGRVRFAGYRNGLGQIIDIDQPNGFSTRYAHLNRLLVTPGQRISRHQEIGLVADTGWALWPRRLSEASFALR
jgi:Peptidase family M23